ncbi:MAG: pyruvate dehydrogenase (acetyl-transferring) E1 component subunit alpha [Candidatus Dormibacteraeota bacterium]|nr:pyruvate dehydrogenase (acetyl-transferring) E1 component subunit alpha [Candidatus Dormibacteraeota bacterium]MBV9526419.1 pyruvate dehydrogenase (acetyl-transferring) E1 component subunit alpha [Candidatus Dormibacteraeota bacterium]
MSVTTGRAAPSGAAGESSRINATWQEVAADGGLAAPAHHDLALDHTQLRSLYRLMALSRRVDRQAINLTRQGALGVFASSQGQEAAQVGAVFALDDEDWLFPSYRDSVATFARGVDIVEVLALFQGSWHCGFDPYRYRVAPQTTPVATQALHATGLAMAARMRGDPIVALTLFGEGAASEGDAHEAMNMAGVYQAPVVFLVQNNQYAISVPVSRQTRTESIALRAPGCGMPGVRVDGNDVLSVYGAVRAAVDRARAGGGPTLVEAVTYRLEAHTTADDETRYRNADEVATWRANDPVQRFAQTLRDLGVLDDALTAEVEAEGEELAARMRDSLFGAPAGDPREMFEHVYATPTPALNEQRALLDGELSAEGDA